MWGILVGICGVFFFALGIRHNKEVHKEEGTGTGIISESIILSLLVEGFFWIFDKFPYWIAKSFYFLIALILFIWSYRLFTS